MIFIFFFVNYRLGMAISPKKNNDHERIEHDLCGEIPPRNVEFVIHGSLLE